MARFAFLMVVLLGVAPGRADEGGPGRWSVPAGAKVSVELDRATVFLGENVVLHFVVENTGTAPFRVFTGCDGRNGVRALRFKVTATDEAGREAADPHPVITDHGGLGQEFEVGPGGPRSKGQVFRVPNENHSDVDGNRSANGPFTCQ